jgi:prepilin-type processing-associated H-X9-DG protein
VHTDAHQTFPTGGWSGHLGDPDAGFGPKQPGGWIYNILPYIEQDGLRQLGRGKTGSVRIDDLRLLMQSPLTILHCPSRRLPRNYPYTGAALKNAPLLESAAKTDYAISRAISTEKSEVLISDVQLRGKGMSNTTLVAEKSLSSSYYTTGTGPGDTLVAFVGHSDDISRDVKTGVANDRSGGVAFGGPHPGGVNVARCDGTVRFVGDDETLEQELQQ